MSSSNSPCAACKCLRRKCTQECVFSPYFPPDNPQKFTNVHNVFGASNVSKLLNELNVAHREDAVNSLAFEAESRLKDPVYGCVGVINSLQHRLRQVHHDLEMAKKELSTYIGPSAMLPIINHPGFVQQNYGPSTYQMAPQPPMGLPTGIPTQLIIQERQQQREQQFLDAQQIAAAAATAAREQEMMRTYEQQLQQQQQQQQQTEIIKFINGFEENGGSVTATGFNQMGGSMQQPTLALGSSFEAAIPYHQIEQQNQNQNQEQGHLNPHQLDLDLQDLLQFQPQNGTTSHQPELPQSSQTQASHTQQQLLLEEEKSIGPSC